MEYKRFGSRMVLRIDRGEEVLTQLRRAAEQEGIRLAAVSGLGAVGDFTVRVFHTAEKQYHAHRFQGDFEIVSLVGTITTKDGEFYAPKTPTSTPTPRNTSSSGSATDENGSTVMIPAAMVDMIFPTIRL